MNTTTKSLKPRHSFHTFTTRQNANKKERVSTEKHFQNLGKNITDHVDPEFFTFVFRRRSTIKPNLHEYITDLRKCFFARLKTAYIHEEINQIDNLCKRKSNQFEESLSNFKYQKANFEKFLYDDHYRCQTLINDAIEIQNETKKLEEIFELKTEELDKTESQVDRLKEKWEEFRKMEWFLKTLAPFIWTPHKRNEFDLDDDFELFSGDPDKILEIFKDVENKNMNALLHYEKLNPLKATMEKVKEMTMDELNIKLDVLINEVATCETIALQLENDARQKEDKVRKLANGHVRGFLTDKDALSVIAWVEEAYERVIEPNDGDLGPIEMVKALESKFEQLALALELEPRATVAKMNKKLKLQDVRINKEAQIAQKKMHQLEMLEKHFLGAIKPLPRKLSRKLRPRSQPPPEPKIKRKLSTPPTEQARDEKLFFSKEFDIYRPLL